jgi:predicted alpha/beta superfamily hydrolase
LTHGPAVWEDYPPADGGAHTVTGTVKVLRHLAAPSLEEARDVYVYLPPGHGDGERFPVLYMQDGQNLFDVATSFAGEWCVDESMEALAAEGLRAIVVGIANGDRRLDEYSPFEDDRGGGQGDDYLQFLTATVKPLVDAAFATRPERRATGIGGSSMGGLIALYGVLARPDVFGCAAVMSPALWFADRAVLRYTLLRPRADVRLYVDIGTAEGDEAVGNARLLRRLLRRKGYREGDDVLYVEEAGAGHEEAAWARRWPLAARFLLAHG